MFEGLTSNTTGLGLTLFAAIVVLWLIWMVLRGFRRVVGRGRSAPAPPRSHAMQTVARTDPPLGPVVTRVQAVPDAADVLALKASIDALAKQIATLEKRLTPVRPGPDVPANSSVSPADAPTLPRVASEDRMV